MFVIETARFHASRSKEELFGGGKKRRKGGKKERVKEKRKQRMEKRRDERKEDFILVTRGDIFNSSNADCGLNP